MRFALVAAALVLPAVAAAQVTVYANDFESGPLGAEWSGGGSIQSSEGLGAFGFGQNHLRNEGTSASLLTLGALAPHTSMTLAFDLAMWDSIDFGDTFRLFMDGVTLFDGPFGNYFAPSGDCDGPGTRISDPFVDFASPGYGMNAGFRDCARTASFTFAHSGTGAAISFQYPNTQGGLDESFGVDNVLVQTDAAVTAAPEPGTWALLATGLVGVGGVARRRRR